MATVKGPLFSLDASGTVGGSVVYSTWKGRSYVRRHATPANPKSVGQVSVRVMLKFLTQYWVSLSSPEQTDWETRAAVDNISPFNAFVGYNMSRWGIAKYPSKKDPADESDVGGQLSQKAVVAGSRSITVEVAVAVVQQNWGVNIYRSLAPGLTCLRTELVQTIPAESAASFYWLDTPLTPGVTYYYRNRAFSEEAVAGETTNAESGVPTA